MLIIPAIDLQDGAVVRLVQGKFNKKVYSRDPLKTAKHWIKSGAKMLHVVDLDGAILGKSANLEVVKEITRSVNVPVQFGGGVRSIEVIKELLDCGVYRVVLGTRAAEDDNFLRDSFKRFADKLIVSVDVSGENIQINGWQKSAKGPIAVDFVLYLKDIGFKEIIYTDTLKDGTLTGPNVLGAKNMLKQTGIKLIASGGISALSDITKLKQLEKSGLLGVIVGKALYEGKFTLREALTIS